MTLIPELEVMKWHLLSSLTFAVIGEEEESSGTILVSYFADLVLP